MKLSMSDIGGFLTCRQAWWWGSVQNLGTRGTSPALILGTGIHAALERYYRAVARGERGALLTAFSDWVQEQDGEIDGALVDLGLAMLNGYLGEYISGNGEDRDHISFLYSEEAEAIEQEFELPIPGTRGGVLVGTIDGIIRVHFDGAKDAIWLIDHKTYSSAPDRRTLILNHQFLGYTWAAQRLSNSGALAPYGVPPETRICGVLYNGLRKQLPSPRVSAPLFLREWVSHTPMELYTFETRLIDIHNEMSADGVGPHAVRVYPSPSQACSYCAFQVPCVARQLGEDWEWIIEQTYIENPPRGKVYGRVPTATSEE